MNKIYFFLKGFLTLILVILNMNTAIAHNKIPKSDGEIVLKYDYSPDQFIKASSVEMFKSMTDSFHKRGIFKVTLLGEKEEIQFPEAKEIFVNFFSNKFSSMKIFFYPNNEWKKFETIINEIKEKRAKLKDLGFIALKKQEFNLNLLTPHYMKNHEGIMIDCYEMEHYTLYLLLKKFIIPEEIYPRDQDYFQLYVRIITKD